MDLVELIQKWVNHPRNSNGRSNLGSWDINWNKVKVDIIKWANS